MDTFLETCAKKAKSVLRGSYQEMIQTMTDMSKTSDQNNFFELFRESIDQLSFGEPTQKLQRDLLRIYIDYSARAFQETTHKDYCNLQVSWNYQVLIHSSKHILNGLVGRDRMLSLGSFLGLTEMAYAHIFQEVFCVDLELYLPKFKVDNIKFHKADLDGSNWTLPSGRFNAVFMIEILEHLLWSPVPLLKTLNKNCDLLVITTPDDDEWPAMPPHPYNRYQHFSAIPSASPGVSGNPAPMFHCKQYSQSEFIELLDFCGFRVIEFQRIGPDCKQMLAICTPR